MKNAELGFAIPYSYNGEAHDHVPDFVVRIKSGPPVHPILEVKGFDPLKDVKAQAAQRWVEAVNADGSYGLWSYALASKPPEVAAIITNMATKE